MDANTQKGFHPEVQAKDSPEAVKKGRVLVISEVLFAVDSLADLPKGRFVVEAPNGDLKEFETGKIPTEKLMEGIAAGRVFAHWGSNIARLDELHPNWALSALHRPRRIEAFEHQWPHSERAIRVASRATEPAEGSLRTEDGFRDDGEEGLVVRNNYKGFVFELRGANVDELYEAARLKWEMTEHPIHKPGYAAAMEMIERHPQRTRVKAEPIKPVVQESTQGTLL